MSVNCERNLFPLLLLRSSVIHLRGSILLSICPFSFVHNVGRVFPLFMATKKSYNKSNDPKTCFESVFHCSDVLSRVRLSVSPCMSNILAPNSIHTETQSGRIVARLGLFHYCSCSNAWLTIFYHCSCPPARDLGTCVSGFVFLLSRVVYYKSVCTSLR